MRSAIVALGAALVLARSMAASPHLLWDLATTGAAPGGYPGFSAFAAVERGVVFSVPEREELWATDGTGAATESIARFEQPPGSFLRAGACALFVADGALWGTDGTAAGTRRLTAAPVSAYLEGFGGPRFALLPLCRSTGREPRCALWRSDGTPRGTRPIAELRRMSAPVLFHGALWFVGFRDGRAALWRSDGTIRGTRAVKGLGLVRDPVLLAG